MSDIDVNGLMYFASYHKAIMAIPDAAIQLQAFRAVTTYMMTGEIMDGLDWQVQMLIEGLKPNIDKSRNAVERGSKGGRPPKTPKTEVLQTEKPKSKEVSATEKAKEEEIEEEIEKEKEEGVGENKKNAPAPAREEQIMYGTNKNVPLTPDQYAELEKECGFQFYDTLNRLSDHMASTGRTYKSYPATIRQWVRKDKEKGNARGQPHNRFNNFNQREYTDADYEALEKRTVRR